MQDKPQIPNLDTIKKGIDQLLLIENWDEYKIKSSPKKFEKRFNELFIGNLKLMFYLVYLATDKSLPKKFYRLRQQNKSFNEKLISEYSYPPNHTVKKIQRANIPYFPVFYCSDDPSTAIKETIKSVSKFDKKLVYYMSEWETKPNTNIRICPFIFDNVSDDNPYKILSEINRAKLKETLKDNSDEDINTIFEVLKFLSNLFIYDNTWIVSSYLAHINLYANHNFRPDVFIYPSKQTDRTSVNFAIHPNAVIEKLSLKRIFKLRLSSYDELTKKFAVVIGWVGHNDNGIIEWTQVNEETEQGREMIKQIETTFNSR